MVWWRYIQSHRQTFPYAYSGFRCFESSRQLRTLQGNGQSSKESLATSRMPSKLIGIENADEAIITTAKVLHSWYNTFCYDAIFANSDTICTCWWSRPEKYIPPITIQKVSFVSYGLILNVSCFPTCTVSHDGKSVKCSDTYRFNRCDRYLRLWHISFRAALIVSYISASWILKASTFSIRMASYDAQRPYGYNKYRSQQY